MMKDMSKKQNLNKTITDKKLKEALIWAEILGKPKALRGKGTRRIV